MFTKSFIKNASARPKRSSFLEIGFRSLVFRIKKKSPGDQRLDANS